MRHRSFAVLASLIVVPLAVATELPTPDSAEIGVTPSEQWLGRDANNDGIRDDIASMLSADAEAGSEPAESKVEDELAAARERSAVKPAGEPPSSCLSYLLLDPADQTAANRYVQSRAHGTFGTHPCDPVSSPMLERPFDTDYAQLDLGLVRLQYRHLE